MIKLAILITCYNRKNKTANCLNSLFSANIPKNISFKVFLVDDNSDDGTKDYVLSNFPDIKIIAGTGNLYWAGGMRLAWKTALEYDKYDAFILINDDVILKKDFLELLIKTDNYARSNFGKAGLYSSSTIDMNYKKTSYGGNIITSYGFRVINKRLDPTDEPQKIDTVNANILWVDYSVVNKIGILDEKFTHGLADYDYALRANHAKFPVMLTMGIGGYCDNNHPVNWLNENYTLCERIKYLKSPTGLSYNNYIFYIRRHFPRSFPYSFSMLWLKTLFPIFWRIYKN